MQVIGYFGPHLETDIPIVLEDAVLHDDGTVPCGTRTFVRYGQYEVVDEMISLAEFDQLVAQGTHTRLAEPLPYDENKGLLLLPHAKEPYYCAFVFIDVVLNCWVDSCREDGYALLREGNRKGALMEFDNARRISKELDDCIRVWALEEDEGVKKIWEEYLENQAPDLNLTKRSLSLGLI